MFAYIQGKLVAKYENSVIIDVGGIGYKIFMSSNSLNRLEEVESIVKVHTHYYVREDNISLYGFYSSDELRMFELLLSVSGIGAKSSLAMLSAITPSEFALAIIANDMSKLTKIPGIGAKTAARIVLELKDKLKTEEGINRDIAQGTVEAGPVPAQNIDDAITALKVLGYSKREIDTVLEKFDASKLSLEEIIKKGLSYLGV